MSQTRPKWLLTALIVVAVLGLSVVGYAAPPPNPTITSPTTTKPVAVKGGNNVYVTFRYVSQPAVTGTTRATIRIYRGGTEIGTRVVEYPEIDDTDIYGNTFTAAVAIDGTANEAYYDIDLQITNHDGASGVVTVTSAVLVDNTAPGNVSDFGPIISGEPGPTLTWSEPTDPPGGSDPSGIGWYEVTIQQGLFSWTFHDISADDTDPAPGFQWAVPMEFSDGEYSVSVWARDKAYNKSGTAGTGTVIIDTTDPVLDQQGPVGFVNNASPTLTARFRDLGLGVSGYRHPFNTAATPPDVFKLDDGDISPDSEPVSGAATGIITKNITVLLAEGNHTVALTLHDRADNEASLTWEFFVDTVKPLAPGSLKGPDPTTSDTPTFSWAHASDDGPIAEQSGVAGYTVQIWTTGSGAACVLGPYTVDDAYDEDPDTPEIDWTLPDALPGDGDYQIRVWTVDKAGNSSDLLTPAAFPFRRDTTGPTLDMEEPKGTFMPPPIWTSFDPPTVKVRFRDLGPGATGFKSVDKFFIDDESQPAKHLTPTSTPANGGIGPAWIEATYTGPDLVDGGHTAVIIVSDVAGNASMYMWTFYTDATEPTEPANLIVVGATQTTNPPPDFYPHSATPQFQWDEGTDAGSGVASYNVEIWPESGSAVIRTYTGVVDEDIATSGVQWTIPDAMEEDTILEIRVYTVDNCDNVSADYARKTFCVDTTSSTVLLDQTMPTGFISNKKPTISARFRDVGAHPSGYGKTTEFMIDKGLAGERNLLPPTTQPAQNEPIGNITADITADLAEGQRKVDIKAEDFAHNSFSLSWTFFVDTVKPSAPGAITVTPSSAMSAQPKPIIAWAAATDPGFADTPQTGSGIGSYKAEIWSTGLAPERVLGPYTIDAGAAQPWQFPDALTADGQYKIKLWAVDRAGNESATPSEHNYWLDSVSPTLDNESPTGATNNTWPTLSVRFTDNGGTGYGGVQSWKIGVADVTVTSHPALGDTTDDITGTPPGLLTEGTHNVSITVLDGAGNTATKLWSFTVDTTAPTPPTNVVAPDPTNDTTPTFTWTAGTDGGSGIASHIVEVWTTGGGAAKIRGPFIGITGTTYTLLPSDALSPDGEYEVRVWSVDKAGNVSIAALPTFPVAYGSDTFVLDTGKPVLSNGTPTGIQPGTGTLTMQFADDRTGLDRAGTVITLVNGLGNEGTVGTYSQPPNGSKTGQISAGYSVDDDGTWTVTAKARDLAGNQSDEYTWSFVVDATPPTITVVYPADASTTWDKWTEIRATIEDPNAGDGTPGSGVDTDTIQGYLQGPGLITWPLIVVDFDTVTGLWILHTPFDFDGADGPYKAVVIAEDLAGNAGEGVSEFAVQQTYAPGLKALPQFVNVVDLGLDAITVEWDDVDNEEKYELQVSRDPGFSNPDILLLDEDTKSHRVEKFDGSDLENGAYYFRIRAVAYGGRVSLWSNTVSTTVDLTPPDAPIMQAIPEFTKDNSVTFSWTSVADAVHYLFTYTMNGDSTTEMVTLDSFVLDISDRDEPDVITGSVCAVDAAGNLSIPSNIVTTTIDRTPPTVAVEVRANGQLDPLTDGTLVSDPRPVWSWSVDQGTSPVDYYLVSLDGEAAYETTEESYQPASNLSEGLHSVWVQAVDMAGNETDGPTGVSVIVDTTPPSQPGVPTTDKSPTNDTTPSWTWTASESGDAASYNVYLDGVLKWTVDEASFTIPEVDALSEGAHYLEVTALDALGNESVKSGPGYVVIDTTAPSDPVLTLHTPSPTNEWPQSWSWTASEGADGYMVSVNGGALEDVGNVRTYETWFKLSGNYTFAVKAYDLAGNEGNAVEGSVTVDVTGPAKPKGLELTEPEGTPIGAAIYTADSTPKVKWDAVADADLDHYVLEIDGQAWVVVNEPATAYEFTEGLEDGAHTVRVMAVDALGNEGDYSDAYTFIVDTAPPGRPDMPTTTPILTNQEDQEWTWNAVTDAGCGLNYYEVRIDGVEIVSPKTETKHTTSLTDGVHFLQVRSIDKLGNTSLWSDPGYVTVDLTPPGIPLMKTLPPFTNAATVRFEWTKSSADTDHYEISYTVDGGEEWSDPLEVAGEFYVVNIADVSDGMAVSGKVRAYDKAGNKSVWSNELLGAPIAWTIVDRTGPVVTITKPTEAITTNAATFRYEWTAVDAGCGVKSYTIEFNGSKHQVDETTVDNKYWYEATLIEGNNTFKVFAADQLGNVGETKVAPIVRQVKPQIFLVQPMPGAEYKINEISTIAFQVIGLYDAMPEVRLNGELLDAWRIVTVVNTPAMAKFYILLDSDVIVPGPMGIRITVGAGSELFSYTVNSERSGFGFGRLRPW